MILEPPTPTQRQVVDAVHGALAYWPNETNWSSPDDCWIGFDVSAGGGYRLSVEIPTGGIKLAPNPCSAETAAHTLWALSAQAAAAAAAISDATRTGR